MNAVKIDKNKDLMNRTFDFAVKIIQLVKAIRYSKENDVIKYQLTKAATSIGANYEEAQSAYSRDDFKYKIGICLRETKESNYWLRILKAANISSCKELDFLIQDIAVQINVIASP